TEVTFFSPENYIATLYIGTRVPQFEGFTERPERIHLDLVVATDVDAAEHGDHHWHGNRVYRARDRAPDPGSVKAASFSFSALKALEQRVRSGAFLIYKIDDSVPDFHHAPDSLGRSLRTH